MSGTRSSNRPALDFRIVPTQEHHGRQIREVILLANGYDPSSDTPCIDASAVVEQLERFPEGQFVAVTGTGAQERVIGTATTLRTRRPPSLPPLPWHQVIGSYGLANHDPDGSWLYGVEIAVNPEFQRRGVASALYRTRLGLVKEMGLKGWYAGGMLMGYHRYRDRMSPREYGRRVLRRELADPTVTMQINRGLRPWGLIEDYYPEPKAGNTAVLLSWRPSAPRSRRPAAPVTGPVIRP